MKEGWKIVKFSEIAQVVGGSTPKTNIKSFWDGDNYWVTPAELKGEKYINKTERTITNEAVSKTNLTLLPKGTVLLSSRAPIGKVCITKVPMYCNQGFKNIVCKDSLYNEFVYYYLLYSVPYLESLGTGATFKEISKRVVENVEIPLPPLEEQHRIVGILDTAFAKIDALKANAEANLANAKALFQQVLAQELQPKEGWVEKKLGEIATFSQGVQVPLPEQSMNMLKGYNRFLRIIDYTQGNEAPRYTSISDSKYRMSKDDIAIVRYGASTGFICMGIEGILANNLFKVNINNQIIDNYYMSYVLKSDIFQSIVKGQMNGAAMPAISFGLIKDVAIPYPTDIAEQHRIVSTLDTLSEKCRRLEQVAQQTIRECDALKQSILRQAFSGEL